MDLTPPRVATPPSDWDCQTAVAAVYVHVPFCRHRCGYCNFTLIAGRDHWIERYLQALKRELQPLPAGRKLQTLYLGGGTPSHLNDAQLVTLMEILREKFEWDSHSEVTLEVNPLDLQRDRSSVWKECGINRLSLGVQSLTPHKLQILERDHQPDDVRRCCENARRLTDNLSLDLIFAAPGEDSADWQYDLEQASALNLPHLSAYELTYEKGTSFWSRRRRGQQLELSEELRTEMYLTLCEQMAADGRPAYEISNFARPGHESRHNQVYWTGGSYWGFGPGASGFVDGYRYTNIASTPQYCRRLETNQGLWTWADRLSPADSTRELTALGLRRLAGVKPDQIETLTGINPLKLIAEPLARLADQGWLYYDHSLIRLTPAGILFYDTVASEIFLSNSQD